jgi:multiple sugar transport system substrate-binding protein
MARIAVSRFMSAAMIVALGTAACAGPAAPPTQPPVVETVVVTQPAVVETVEVVVSPTPEPEATAAPLAGEVRIAVVQGAMRSYMEPMADAFMAANPDVTVTVEEEPEGGAFEALIAAGNQPDIVVGSFGYMPAKYAAMDALAPLEAMPGADALFAELDPNTVQEYYGHKYYVPAGIDITMMIYNKALFEEAGLDPDKPPQTQAEFLAAAEAISALPAREDGTKVYGTVFWNEALAWGGWYWNMLQPIYLSNNANSCALLNRIGTDVVFDQPDCQMQSYLEFSQQAQQFAPPDMTQTFFNRSIGMWLQYGYSWEPNLKDAKDQPMVLGEDVGVAPVPVPEAGMQPYTTLGGRPYMVLKTTPERELLAWEFIKFLMTDENSLEFCKQLGYLPVKLSLKEDAYFADPARKPFVDMLPFAIFPQALAQFDGAANEILKTYAQVVVEGSLEPDAGVTQAAETAREAISP